jgi:hypothetical protein
MCGLTTSKGDRVKIASFRCTGGGQGSFIAACLLNSGGKSGNARAAVSTAASCLLPRWLQRICNPTASGDSKRTSRWKRPNHYLVRMWAALQICGCLLRQLWPVLEARKKQQAMSAANPALGRTATRLRNGNSPVLNDWSEQRRPDCACSKFCMAFEASFEPLSKLLTEEKKLQPSRLDQLHPCRLIVRAVGPMTSCSSSFYSRNREAWGAANVMLALHDIMLCCS